MKKRVKLALNVIAVLAAVIASIVALLQYRASRLETVPPREIRASVTPAPPPVSDSSIDVTPTLQSSFEGRWHAPLSGREFELRPVDASNFYVYEVTEAGEQALGYATVHGGTLEVSMEVEKRSGDRVATHTARIKLHLEGDGNRLAGTFYGDTSAEHGPIEWRRAGA